MIVAVSDKSCCLLVFGCFPDADMWFLSSSTVYLASAITSFGAEPKCGC